MVVTQADVELIEQPVRVGCERELAGARWDLVDLDGAMFLAEDRRPAALYRRGTVHCPDVWGVP